ncbi:hypothetical protein Hypma_009814 [Hypsizygus marmoreus]|uniref:Uncharacterized protein n=1 Tax=Hypsizygus marmoreus TaxID=39966 RepID=A0A369JLH9_HYPMA|nr:hypothetical protein Hypma_009814 [Hypsizygus marmoreus]
MTLTSLHYLEVEESMSSDLSAWLSFASPASRPLEPTQDRTGLAGGVLKNITKLRWEEDVQPLAEQDKAVLQSKLLPKLLPAMLSSPANKAVHAQVAKSVSLIAEL